MSEQTKKTEKIYINGCWLLEKTFQDGSSILKMSILPEKFIESIKSLKPDENGFVKLVISKSRLPKPGSSHYIVYDDYQKPAAAKPTPVKKTAEKVTVPEKESEDVRDFV